VNVDELAPGETYEFVIANSSPNCQMRLHFGAEATATVQGIEKPEQYPVVLGNSIDDVERFPFDVAEVEHAFDPKQLQEFMKTPYFRKYGSHLPILR
jgi:hypothetical protein